MDEIVPIRLRRFCDFNTLNRYLISLFSLHAVKSDYFHSFQNDNSMPCAFIIGLPSKQ